MECLHGRISDVLKFHTECGGGGEGGGGGRGGREGEGEEGKSVRVTTNCISYSEKKIVETLYQFFMILSVLCMPVICLKKRKLELLLLLGGFIVEVSKI